MKRKDYHLIRIDATARLQIKWSSFDNYLAACFRSKHRWHIKREIKCFQDANGYGRVDIRMDKTSQELFVLEVNANCSISSQPFSPLFEESQSSVGTILHLAGIPFAQLMSEILAEAFVRHSTKY